MNKKKLFLLLGTYTLCAIICVSTYFIIIKPNYCHEFHIYKYGMPSPCTDCSNGELTFGYSCCGPDSETKCGFGALLTNLHILNEEVATNISGGLPLPYFIMFSLFIILLPIGILYKRKSLIIIAIILAAIPIFHIIKIYQLALSRTLHLNSLPV